ncbi:GTP pyrophosphokinase [Jiangella anatolica]|uniref:RelA/SpoT domain-containing protein n=1 Tax=Jiangella anatolica TaxID=2670374 RepID=A0A2W2C080_9ACTN|nr:hypothetical protein [Jiangella anatolica]PZF81709.1 hypothetical protein C1I92_19800 [Jiangella anatolica]
MAEPTADDWGARYGARRGMYEQYAGRLQILLRDVLTSAGIDVVQIEARAKTVESFVEKIGRKGHDDDPLATMTDLVGLRVITYYVEDVERVGQLIAREFEVDEENSADKATDLASNEFGYRSAHHVVRLGPSRRELAEWAPFASLAAEIQVRTALQHAWAAVSHKVAYKAAALPEPIQRRLNRLSALFELADEQFSSLRDASAATDSDYRQKVDRGTLDIPVDTSSIGAYLDGRRGDELATLFQRHGFDRTVHKDVRRRRRARSALVSALQGVGLGTLADLDAFVSDAERMDAAVGLVRRVYETDGHRPRGPLDDLLTMTVTAALDFGDEPGRPYLTEQWSDTLKRVRQGESTP